MPEEMTPVPEYNPEQIDRQWVRDMWLEAAEARAKYLTDKGMPTTWKDVLHEIALTDYEIRQIIKGRDIENSD